MKKNNNNNENKKNLKKKKNNCQQRKQHTKTKYWLVLNLTGPKQNIKNVMWGHGQHCNDSMCSNSSILGQQINF